MTPAAFERFLGVDWSGARKGGKVFLAEVTTSAGRHRVERLERATRQSVEAELAAPSARRTLAGLDFCFSFPEAFRVEGRADWTWPDLRSWALGLSGPSGAADVTRALAACPEREQFRLVGGDKAPALRRSTERACEPLPASVVHLLPYQRQVCLGSIHGIAMLDRLAQRPGLAVWPFDEIDPGTVDTVLAEVYPAMWVDSGIAKSRPSHRLRQLRRWQDEVDGMTPAVVDLLLDSEDAFDALAVALALPDVPLNAPDDDVVAREGWILGVPPAFT